MKTALRELKTLVTVLWDQILLSIIFAVIIYFTEEDYNFNFKKNESLLEKILRCLHFSVVTQYTVGYGYVVPKTVRGQVINIIHMILSYYLLAKDVNESIN
tara:strand:+ start:565 stop:867 length:303 start_codon:yes stop_codon:yes gene_type:complete